MLRGRPEQLAITRSILVVAETGEKFHSLADAVNPQRHGPASSSATWAYRGNVRIDKPMEIVGDGAPADVVLDGGHGPAITIDGDNVTVRGLSLKMSGPGWRGVKPPSRSSLATACSTSARSRRWPADSSIARAGEVDRCFAGPNSSAASSTASCSRWTPKGCSTLCEIVAAPRSALVISDRANPVIRHLKVVDPGYRAVMAAENGGGVIDDSILSGGKGPVVELAKGSTTIFRRVQLVAGNGPLVLGASGARLTFIQCDPPPGKNAVWTLAAGHQVSRI